MKKDPLTEDDFEITIESESVNEGSTTLDDVLAPDKAAVAKQKRDDEAAKRKAEYEQKAKQPFMDVYSNLKGLKSKILKPFVKLNLIEEFEYDAFKHTLKNTQKGVGYVHYATFKFQYEDNSMVGGMLSGVIGGGAGGAAVGGPPGFLIGSVGGAVAGIAASSPTVFSWKKGISKRRRKKYYLTLDENFSSLYQLASQFETRLKEASFHGELVNRLKRKERNNLLETTEQAYSMFTTVHKCFDGYQQLLRDGWYR